MSHTPFLLVLSAPSGTGKTTICRKLLTLDPGLSYSVSATTRKKRKGEEDKVDYVFLEPEEFQRWMQEGKLLEWTTIYGESYGTPKGPIFKFWEAGKDVLLNLDVEGKRNLERLLPGRVVSVFLLPPDLETLKARLAGRGGESPEKLRLRMEQAKQELEWAREYTYWVLNAHFESAVRGVLTIIQAERMRRERIYYPHIL